MKINADEIGQTLRRKKSPRGWYHLLERDFVSPSTAAREAVKTVTAAREAGKLAALKSFGLLHGKDDPVKGLTKLYRTDDFGLPRRESRDSFGNTHNTRRPYNGC